VFFFPDKKNGQYLEEVDNYFVMGASADMLRQLL